MSPVAPPNAGPMLREIIKYGPPPCILPLVTMAEKESAVSTVVEKERAKMPSVPTMPACGKKAGERDVFFVVVVWREC